MLSRTLNLAAVMLLIGGFAAAPAQAQNLEAGKTPSQIFSGTCAACHKGARGLLRTVAPGSLPGFLRQHYTTSSEMAGVLAAYLISNGATDTRYTGGQPKQQGRDVRQEPTAAPSGTPTQLDRFGRPIRRAPTQEAARPDGDGRMPPEPDGRARSRVATPEAGRPDGQVEERGPDGRRLSPKQRMSKRGKPNEELPKADTAKPDAPMGEAAKGAVSPDDKPSVIKDEASKPEVKPEEEKSDSAKLDSPKGEGTKSDVPVRAEPVPAVTPAPKSPEGESTPAQAAAPSEGSTGSSAPPAANPAAEAPVSPAPPAPPVAAAPVAPAGPPAPPISQ